MMRIALAQQNYHIGNFADNLRKILDQILEASKQGAELIVFSELAVCGYPPRDFLEFKDFIDQCYHSIDLIREETGNIGVIVGSPARNPSPEGKDLFNAAWLLYEKEVKGVSHKTCLPTYDVFDENRYFEPGYAWQVIPFKGRKIALTICEDIWSLGNYPLYRICPMDRLIGQGPDLMINISASPFDYDHDDDRKEIIRSNVLKYHLPMVYCNAVGSQTEIVFDGGSLIYDEEGNIIQELKYFEEDFTIRDVDLDASSATDSAEEMDPEGSGPVAPVYEELLPGLSVVAEAPPSENRRPHSSHPISVPAIGLNKEMRVSKLQDPDRIVEYLVEEHNISQIHEALILGIRDYFRKMGFSQAILGSSGGIDSSVTLALACEALGNKQVRALLMPSPFSSAHSISDAKQLSENLGNPYDIVPINDIYEAFTRTLGSIFKDLPFNLAEENIQSRARGNLLMALANKFGYILLNTSNKSELATGYGTLYGDMAGGLSVLGDLYKVQVYALANHINRQSMDRGSQMLIPKSVIEKEPSAELRPGQKDSDSLPPYPVLDKILYQYIEKRRGPREIQGTGIDESLISGVLKLVNTNEYKRNQFCPIIRVSCKAFGIGRRVPIVGRYLS
jgi:NAD+ synthase (glutamine-hydrolysing)